MQIGRFVYIAVVSLGAGACALPSPDASQKVEPLPVGTVAGEIVFETDALAAAPSLFARLSQYVGLSATNSRADCTGVERSGFGDEVGCRSSRQRIRGARAINETTGSWRCRTSRGDFSFMGCSPGGSSSVSV